MGPRERLVSNLIDRFRFSLGSQGNKQLFRCLEWEIRRENRTSISRGGASPAAVGASGVVMTGADLCKQFTFQLLAELGGGGLLFSRSVCALFYL